MKKILAVCVLLTAAAPAFAQRKPCEQIAAEIAERLDAKGVRGFKIDIVSAGEAGDQKVIGSCEAGAKKITYKKASTAKARPSART